MLPAGGCARNFRGKSLHLNVGNIFQIFWSSQSVGNIFLIIRTSDTALYKCGLDTRGGRGGSFIFGVSTYELYVHA